MFTGQFVHSRVILLQPAVSDCRCPEERVSPLFRFEAYRIGEHLESVLLGGEETGECRFVCFYQGPYPVQLLFGQMVQVDGDDVIVCGDTMRQPAFVVVCRDGEVVQLPFYVLRFLGFPFTDKPSYFLNQGGIATAAYLFD